MAPPWDTPSVVAAAVWDNPLGRRDGASRHACIAEPDRVIGTRGTTGSPNDQNHPVGERGMVGVSEELAAEAESVTHGNSVLGVVRIGRPIRDRLRSRNHPHRTPDTGTGADRTRGAVRVRPS